MRLYGCNIGSLYGIDEIFDVYLIGLPKVPEITVTMYVWGDDLKVMLPQDMLSGIKLLIFKHGLDGCVICDVEVEGNTVILQTLLHKYGIDVYIQYNDQVLYGIEQEIVSIGKKGFYTVSIKDESKDCQKVYLKSECFNVLGRKINGVYYSAKITPKERRSEYTASLRKIINGSKLEVKDMTTLLTNDEEIIMPSHIDYLKNFEIYTPEFSFAYNPIEAVLEVCIVPDEYLIKEDLFSLLLDMYITKLCYAIRDNNLKETICQYFI